MPKMGRDGRRVRDELIRHLRAQGKTLSEIGDDPDVQLSAMSVSRVLAALQAGQRRSTEPPPSRVLDEHGEILDFTSMLDRFRIEQGNVGDQVFAAYRRWRFERLCALPEEPPPLDPGMGAGVEFGTLEGAADALGLSLTELAVKLWRDDAATVSLAMDRDVWTQAHWEAVQSYRRWLRKRREEFLSAPLVD